MPENSLETDTVRDRIKGLIERQYIAITEGVKRKYCFERPRQWPLVLLLKVGWKQGEVTGSRLCHIG